MIFTRRMFKCYARGMPDVPRVPLQELGKEALYLFLPLPWILGWIVAAGIAFVVIWPSNIVRGLTLASVMVGVYVLLVIVYKLSKSRAIPAWIEWHSVPSVLRPGPNRAPKPILYEPDPNASAPRPQRVRR